MFDLDPTLARVLLGAGGIGAISGGLGCFAYLRRQSLIGDVVAHSTLLGVVLAFLLAHTLTGEGSTSLVWLLPGAAAAGLAALALTRLAVSRTRLREDAALGAMLALFFGSGLLLLRWIERASPPIAGHRGLEEFLFGMAAAMTDGDLAVIGVVGVLALAVVVLLWKELKALTFDPLFAAGLGLRVRLFDGVLLGLLVAGIVVGIRAVGVVLMIALLVTPAAAARQWTRSLGPMVLLACAMGAASGALGAFAGSGAARLPTGPVVVLVVSAVFVLSILVAPGRGVLWGRAEARDRADSEVEAAP